PVADTVDRADVKVVGAGAQAAEGDLLRLRAYDLVGLTAPIGVETIAVPRNTRGIGGRRPGERHGRGGVERARMRGGRGRDPRPVRRPWSPAPSRAASAHQRPSSRRPPAPCRPAFAARGTWEPGAWARSWARAMEPRLPPHVARQRARCGSPQAHPWRRPERLP